ncbi:MAG: LacI family transcriptional regulator [Treponema sp.]|jgi:LacI family transcriptional regulator|nr:LacI family transcriptional regulator [Treponema sp.]
MVTIKDLARMAGVSPTTICNVLNDREHKMKAETLKKVQEVIKETNYVPNMGAKLLGNHGPRLIGVIISHIDTYNVMRNPTFSETIGVLEQEFHRDGYFLMFYASASVEESLRIADSWNVAGLIVMGCQMDECSLFMRKTITPLVFIDSYFCDDGLPYVNAGLNDRHGGYLITKYLIEQGHRSIAYLSQGKPGRGVYYERRRGIQDAMEEQGLPFGEDNVFTLDKDKDERAGFLRKNIDGLIKKFTALFFAHDRLAAESMLCLQDMGINIPGDISLCGFDGSLYSSLCQPRLVTARQNIPDKAANAAALLMRLIRKEPLQQRIIQLDVSLVSGGSVKKI